MSLSSREVTSLTHRAYTAIDRDDCIAVFQSNVPKFFRERERSEFVDFLGSCLAAGAREESDVCRYFVVLMNDQVVGCGGYGLRVESVTADLCWGMVQAPHHGSRIGEYLLLARLHEIVTTTDAQAIRLGTSQLTEQFFQRYGFATQRIAKDGIDRGLDDVEMWLELSDKSRRPIIDRWERVSETQQ